MTSAIFTLKLVRAFGFGVCIRSPKLNGLSFDITIGCLVFAVWSRGNIWFKAVSYWV